MGNLAERVRVLGGKLREGDSHHALAGICQYMEQETSDCQLQSGLFEEATTARGICTDSSRNWAACVFLSLGL